MEREYIPGDELFEGGAEVADSVAVADSVTEGEVLVPEVEVLVAEVEVLLPSELLEVTLAVEEAVVSFLTRGRGADEQREGTGLRGARRGYIRILRPAFAQQTARESEG